jgi:uncharacterized membrane protein
MTDEPSATRETGRIEAFSDAVFAIAITVLVLDLRVPAPGRFAETLLSDWSSYLAYLAAFATIASIWLHHHTVFRRIARVEPAVLLLNLLLLLGVSVVPWPTSLIAAAVREGTRSDQIAAVAVYTLVSLVVSASWTGLGFALAARPRLLVDPADTGWMRLHGYQAMLAAIPILVAGALVFVSPIASLLVFVAVPAYFIAVVSTTGWRRPRD